MDRNLTTTSTTALEPKVDLHSTGGSTPATKSSPGRLRVDSAADMGWPVRVISVHEYKEAAFSLAEAFAEDHVARYFIDTPDRAHWTEEQKWELHVKILEYIVYAHCLKGLVTTVGPNYGGVALWMPPGKNMDDLFTIFRSGMWRLNYQLSTEGKKRFFNEFLPLLHDAKAAVLGDRDDESWYLVYIGVRPAAQRKGYSRKLIEHVTDMADREYRACYLESSNDINPKIYAKFGFEIKKKIYLQRAEEHIPLDLMVREPKMPNASGAEKTSEKRIERL